MERECYKKKRPVSSGYIITPHVERQWVGNKQELIALAAIDESNKEFAYFREQAQNKFLRLKDAGAGLLGVSRALRAPLLFQK